MIDAIGAIAENIGALAGLSGIVWRMWDNRSTGAGVTLGIALACLIIGGAITGDL